MLLYERFVKKCPLSEFFSFTLGNTLKFRRVCKKNFVRRIVYDTYTTYAILDSTQIVRFIKNICMLCDPGSHFCGYFEMKKCNCQVYYAFHGSICQAFYPPRHSSFAFLIFVYVGLRASKVFLIPESLKHTRSFHIIYHTNRSRQL